MTMNDFLERIEERFSLFRKDFGKSLNDLKNWFDKKLEECQKNIKACSEKNDDLGKKYNDLESRYNELLENYEQLLQAYRDIDDKLKTMNNRIDVSESIERDFILKPRIMDYHAYADERGRQLSGQSAFESIGEMLCYAARYAESPDEKIARVLRDTAANGKTRFENPYSRSASNMKDRSDEINELNEKTLEELHDIAGAEQYPFVPYRKTLETCADQLNALFDGDLSRCKELKARMEGMGYCFVPYGSRQQEGMGMVTDYNISNCGFSYPALYYLPRKSGEKAMNVCYGGELADSDRAKTELT